MFQPSKSVKVVYLGGKMRTTTTTTAPAPATTTTTTAAPAGPPICEETKKVFQGATIATLPCEKVVRPEDVTENECIRQGCKNFAIVSSEWEDEYCSNECAVRHCKDVFTSFVAASRQAMNAA